MCKDKLEEFYSHTWHKKWPDEILNAPELSSRRKRSHNLKIISLDQDRAMAVFQSGNNDKRINNNTYVTTLTDCTCRDFLLGHGERPCKHILRLADELGLFHNENFETGEHDYTTTKQEYFLPKIPYELGKKLEAVAEHEGRTLSEQVNVFLERSLALYLHDKRMKLLEFNVGQPNEGYRLVYAKW